MADDHSAPQDGLDPDEPHTPLWVTFLGAALFAAVAVFFLATAEPEAPAAAAPTADDAAPAQTVAVPIRRAPPAEH